MKHTPGPWNVEEHHYEVGLSLVVGKQSPNDTYAFTLAETYGKREIREANARIISAAPDLLMACKIVMCGTEWMTKKDFEFIKNAINKAEGTI